MQAAQEAEEGQRSGKEPTTAVRAQNGVAMAKEMAKVALSDPADAQSE